jgi:hypothetical protein
VLFVLWLLLYRELKAIRAMLETIADLIAYDHEEETYPDAGSHAEGEID